MKNLWQSIICLLIISTLSASAGALTLKDEPTSGVLTIFDGDKPVLSYCYGDQLKEGVDSKYTRSTYIHPLYSLDGEPITDDFPSDHFHHHGISWSWPKITVGTTATQTWHPDTPLLRQYFSRWLDKSATDTGSTLSLENKWLMDNETLVATEKVTVVVNPVKSNLRRIDLTVTIEAAGQPLTLKGTDEGNKGYGGMAVRMAPAFKGARLLTDSGSEEKDVVGNAYKWVDISTANAGLTIIPNTSHPNQPLKWMARNSYAGFINASWPGLTPVTLQPGEDVTLSYHLLVRKGESTQDEITSQVRSIQN